MSSINIDSETSQLSISPELQKKIEYLIESSLFMNFEKEAYKKIFQEPKFYFRDLNRLFSEVATSINRELDFVVGNEEFQKINLEMYNDIMKVFEKYSTYNPEHKNKGLKIRDKEVPNFIDDIEDYINILYEYKIKHHDLEVLRDLARLRTDCQKNMTYFKSDKEMEDFLSQFDNAIKSGDIPTAKKMIKELQDEILDEWKTYVPDFENMTDDNFCFIGHSTNSTKFEGNFYDNYVSTSLYNQDVNDTYNGKYGFIMMPTNIVGAKSEDMYANNISTSAEGILAYSLIAKIDHPKRILEELKQQKEANLKRGKTEKVYSEIIQKGFHPVGIFCFTNGALSLDRNYRYAKELQSNFPNLRLKVIDVLKIKKGIDLTQEKINLINDLNEDYTKRHNISTSIPQIKAEELKKYEIFFQNFTNRKENGEYDEEDIRNIFEHNKNLLNPLLDLDQLFTSFYSKEEIKFILNHNYALNIDEILKGNIQEFWLQNMKDKLKNHIGKLNEYIDGLDELVTILNKTEITTELVNEMRSQKKDNLYLWTKVILNHMNNNLQKRNVESKDKLSKLQEKYNKLQEELKNLNEIKNLYEESYFKVIKNEHYYTLAKQDYVKTCKEIKNILEKKQKSEEKVAKLQEKLLTLENQQEVLKNSSYEDTTIDKEIKSQIIELENINNTLKKHSFLNRIAILKKEREIKQLKINRQNQKRIFDNENKNNEMNVYHQICSIKKDICFLRNLLDWNQEQLKEENKQLSNIETKMKELFDCRFDEVEEKIKDAHHAISEEEYLGVSSQIRNIKIEIETVLYQTQQEKEKSNQNHQTIENLILFEQNMEDKKPQR